MDAAQRPKDAAESTKAPSAKKNAAVQAPRASMWHAIDSSYSPRAQEQL
jgi:hypothetical protein